MTSLNSPRERLRLLLWLVAAHSCLVGVGLILHPARLLAFLGFQPVTEPFFPAQGGVFHVVVAVGYAMAARAPERHRSLIVFAVVVKALATVFLVTYWLLISHLWSVLASGLVDGLMALVIAAALASWQRAVADGGS